MTPSLSSPGQATFDSGIDGSSPTARLYVDPAWRLDSPQHLRGRPASRVDFLQKVRGRRPRTFSTRRFLSVRNIAMAVAGLFALMGVVAASHTLSKSNIPSGSSTASIPLPPMSPLARDQQQLPAAPQVDASAIAPNQMPTPITVPAPVPMRPSDAAPSATVAKPAPVQETAAIQPQRKQPRPIARAAYQNNCSNCPPIDAADLPPLGPVTGPN
jgi:hypothetical protein